MEGEGGGGVKETKSTVSLTFFLLKATLGSLRLIDFLFCPVLLGTHFQCFPYEAVTGIIYHLKQHFLPPATALRFTNIKKNCDRIGFSQRK